MGKKNRIETLCTLIRENHFTNQKDLSEALKKEGFNVTQATLSRDMKHLGVTKKKDGIGYSCYVMPSADEMNREEAMDRKERISQSFGFLSAAYSGSLLVLKTVHGYANGLAAAIDDREMPDIIGSLAGDDTVLLILAENTDRTELELQLKEVIPHFEHSR